MTFLQPADTNEAAQMVAEAAARETHLEIVAGGSKRGLGRPIFADRTLDLSRLAGIIDYDPSELVLTAQAATPLSFIETQLVAAGQMLAFEPPDWRSLLNSRGEATLGGTLACNLAGPRRVRAGAPRDHFLGFTAINGRGEIWKAGGRVVKNVTGYDLSKLQAGAFGTLSALTEVTVKVLPKPETACTLVVSGLTDAAAIALLARALNTPWEVSAAAHLPEPAAGRGGLAGGAATVVRIEGPEPSVAYRADQLTDALGATGRLGSDDSARLWRRIGAVQPLLAAETRVVWRICPTPSAAPVLAERLRALLPAAEIFFDWGGGLVWLGLGAAGASEDVGAAVVRAATAAVGGHASLIRADDSVRARVPVFEPPAAGLAGLGRRVKAAFDPRGILNPGRLQEGV